jgi:hypothetical protein
VARRAILISAADQAYWPLLSGLLHSIDKRRRAAGMAIGVLDLGLAAEPLDRLRRYGASVVRPDWDCDVSAFAAKPQPFYRAMTARPFLPRYFAGYDLYAWIDADCWVQDWSAVKLLCNAAADWGFAIVPEMDRSYTPLLHDGRTFADWARSCFVKCFGEAEGSRLAQYPLLNCGVLAATGESPLWALWAKCLAEVLARLKEPYFFAEQTALNACIRTSERAVALLPARCNWMCSRALPLVSADGKSLLDPYPPHEAIGVLHLAADTKRGMWPLVDARGKEQPRALTFPMLP